MAPDRTLTFSGLPEDVRRVLTALARAGHEVALVGGCVRDRLLELPIIDWDATTSATPEDVVAIFPDATWENRFGTVTVTGTPPVEVTTHRAEAGYGDQRRPDEVRFGVGLDQDLARRDFTINAIAWVPIDLDRGIGRLVDPHDGQADLHGHLLRAVGAPRERFAEDALRLIRAARLAGRLDLTIDAATESAIRDLAPTAARVSGERVRDELLRILDADPTPSRAIGLLERLGLLAVILPELAALRGVPQAKPAPGDALDHTLRAVDAAASGGVSDLRLTALLHDLGKATTLADGHFIGHEKVGAQMAAAVLHRLRMPRWRIDRITAAVLHHMFDYESTWTDAAVRRFIRRTDDVDRELLFALRRADNIASGIGNLGDANQDELEGRIAAELERHTDVLVHRRLAVDGHDLQRELGLSPGPEIGAILERLADAVIEDPTVNHRAALLNLARRR